MDDEYNNLMAELGGNKGSIAPAPWVIPDRNIPTNWQASSSIGGVDPQNLVQGSAPMPPSFMPPAPSAPAPPSRPAPPPKKAD